MNGSLAAEPLKVRVLRAVGWALGGQAFAQAIRMLSSLIMTRLLAPEMFGVMAITFMVTVGVAMLADLGVWQNVIRSKQGGNPEFLDTAWVTQILRGALIFLLCLGVSLGIFAANRAGLMPQASTYAEPVLPAVLAAASFSAVISGFASTKLLTAGRELVLGRITMIELASQLLGLASMVAIALLTPTIWALVVGGLLAALAKTLLSHAALPGHGNRFRWHRESFQEILHFGKWVFPSSILGLILSSGDRLLLGGLVSAEALGFYAIASLIVGALYALPSRLMHAVAYPALSEISREHPADLKRTYYRFRAPLDLFGFFALGFLYVSGEEVASTLYDSRYRAVGHQLEILAFSFFPLGLTLAEHCYLALGKPWILTVLTSIRVVTLYATVPLAFHYWGLEGALWAITLNFCFSFFPSYYFNRRCGLFDLRRELAHLWALPAGLAVGVLFDALYALLGRAA
jgi:O-antigen/teichoic acid export membrane protein